MQQQRETFVKGCAEKNKIPAAKANQIFDLLEKFAGYGFNKSHAAAYAIVAYQTAYLKANYPVEFFCAMMTNDMANTEKLTEYIAEAREFGIEVLQPDVNESEMFFAPARVKGCAATNKIPAAKANQIFDLLEKFAGYGFNKSHAAAYAIVAYQTAYLKANYPVEFFCAMMTNDMANTEKLSRIHRRGARIWHRSSCSRT